MGKIQAFLLLLCICCWTVNGASLPSTQKRRAEQITSVFENDDINLQYGYCEKLPDGRGYTAGRAGFTTGTCDAKDVIEKYNGKKPGNGLAKYIVELKSLCSRNSGSTSNLAGYCDQWKQAASDAAFRQAQDEVSDMLYYTPAMKWADKVGVHLPLTLAFMYDTIIQHGEGTDPDGFPALVNRATKKAGKPKSENDEKNKWMPALVEERRKTLAHSSNPDTRKEWAQSVDRAEFFKKLVDEGNWQLNGPIRVKTRNHDLTVP